MRLLLSIHACMAGVFVSSVYVLPTHAEPCSLEETISLPIAHIGAKTGKDYGDLTAAKKGPITRVEMWTHEFGGNDVLHAIVVTYGGVATGQKMGAGTWQPHGKYEVLDLKEGEYIVRAWGGANVVVDRLCLLTNLKQTVCAGGGVYGNYYSFERGGLPLAAITGNAGVVVDGLNLYFGKESKVDTASLEINKDIALRQVANAERRQIVDRVINKSKGKIEADIALDDSVSDNSSVTFNSSQSSRSSHTSRSSAGLEIVIPKEIAGVDIRMPLSTSTESTSSNDAQQGRTDGQSHTRNISQRHLHRYSIEPETISVFTTVWREMKLDVPMKFDRIYFDVSVEGDETEVCRVREFARLHAQMATSLETTVTAEPINPN